MRAPAEHDNVADHGAGWSGGGVLAKSRSQRAGQGRAGLQRKTSRGVGGARARARAGQVMGLVAVAEGLFQELGSMVDNTSLRCTQTNFSNPSASRWTDLESKTVTGITQF